MTMNVRPSRVSIVSGVCTLSSTLTGEDENSISERSRRGRFDGIHQARASSARVNSVSSSLITHPGDLAPGLGPGLVDRAAGRIDHPQTVTERRRPLKAEAESRGEEDRATIPVDAVREGAVVDLDGDLVPPIGGCDADPLLGRAQRVREGQRETESRTAHPPEHVDSPVRD